MFFKGARLKKGRLPCLSTSIACHPAIPLKSPRIIVGQKEKGKGQSKEKGEIKKREARKPSSVLNL
jgi:hypothetical protein